MLVLNTRVLEQAARKHRDAAEWLELWEEITRGAIWRNLDDVRRDFASADDVPLARGVVVTVFNVKGNEYRLLTSIHYAKQTVYVLEMMTHAQYSKQSLWKKRYR